MRVGASLGMVMFAGLGISSIIHAASIGYTQTNLVSDVPGMAATTDPNLANPWGITFGPATPFWISDNHTGLSTVYDSAGHIVPLVVTIPAPGGGQGAPTGVVYNGAISEFAGDKFIFATEDGTIAGWAAGTSAALEVDNSPAGAIYKGLALASNGTGDFLYAANFSAGTIDVFNSNYQPVTLAGSFTDPNIPAGFAPFNIQTFGGNLYVTYAMQDAAKEDDTPGQGNGFVDIYDTNGNLLQKLVTGDPVNHTGPLNSPWGLAMAPASFGRFGNDLLIGNFGNGQINAFDPVTGFFLGTISDTNGNPITNEGLWGLTFGNGGSGGRADTLYFTAGIPGGGAVEDHGLFGSIATPEPATPLLICAALIPLALARRLRKQ